MTPILTVAAAQPDYVALAMVLALILAAAVMALRKYLRSKNHLSQPKPEAPTAAPAVSATESNKPAAPGSAGQVKLHTVPPKTAAMLMAIVADKTGKPLNELRFISIKEVK